MSEGDAKRLLKLTVDYGQKWPLNDIMQPGPRIDWDQIISNDLNRRLREWAAFFNEHADWETGLYGSEERRKWFDSEGRKLLKLLQDEAGERFDFELHLWF
ncbi:hypothetical protein [Agreia sp. COWG]|uniref:hypothetical protein n=1 Tax=Agreia sp. COWG TaxID=2773266 RepID=UPI001925F28F|nr:hypothetical protein [Agreia sp. COWG]CAD5990494.1 conserved protein of unknown function [Agreia sp. COWG]